MVSTTEEQPSNGAIVPVSDVQSSLSGADVGAVVETQTRKVGLIYPPPDIRAIADKTSLYVAKNGEPRFGRWFFNYCTCAGSRHVPYLRQAFVY